jgi:hypothetical protein
MVHPDGAVIVFDWDDLRSTIGRERLEELSEAQLDVLKKCFREGIVHGWTEVAEAAYQTALEE